MKIRECEQCGRPETDGRLYEDKNTNRILCMCCKFVADAKAHVEHESIMIQATPGGESPWKNDMRHISYTLFMVYVEKSDTRRIQLLRYCRAKLRFLSQAFAESGVSSWAAEMDSLRDAVARIPGYDDEEYRTALSYLIRMTNTLSTHLDGFMPPVLSEQTHG